MEGLNKLEELILSKVQQRTPQRMNEEGLIVKSFRYHDLDNSGKADFERFKRAFGSFASGTSNEDLQMFFNRYALGGVITYKTFATEFVSGIRRLNAVNFPEEEGDAHEDYATPADTLQRLKEIIYSQGPRGIIGFAMAMRDADPLNSRMIDYECFSDLLHHVFETAGTPVEEEPLVQLFRQFDQYSPKTIAYDDFLAALKMELSPGRRASIRSAFRRLDAGSEGLVEVSRVFKSFNPNRVMEVAEGLKEADEVHAEFCETLQDLMSYRRGQRALPSNLIAWEEFEDYYKFISGCFESDELFCSTLQKVWDLDKAPNNAVDSRALLAKPAAGIPAKSRTDLHHWQANTLPTNATHHNVEDTARIDDVMLRARRHLNQKGLRAVIDVVKHFYIADDDADDLLDAYEFRRACKQSGIMFNAAEEASIFEACGKYLENGRIQVQKFLDLLHGDMPACREAVIERAFAALGGNPADENSVINPAVLKEYFRAEAHPAVVQGQVSAAALLQEFLDTFSLLAHLRGGCQNGMASFSDFYAYYKVVSTTIENDNLFELIMDRLWLDDAVDESDAAPNSPTARAPDQSAMPVYGAPPSPPRRAPRDEPSEPRNRFSRNDPTAAQVQTTTQARSPLMASSIKFEEACSGELDAVLYRLRDSVARRGLRGWCSLVQRFQHYDNRRNGTVMRLDWERLHKTLGLGLAPDDREVLFRSFSMHRKDGFMDYISCLGYLKGHLTEKRQAWVRRLFNALDNGTGAEEVSAVSLKSCFDPQNAPPVLLTRKDAAQVGQEFRDAVDFFGAGQGFDAEAFEDFFSMVSTVYPEDDVFRLMTTAAFGVSPGTALGGS